MVFVKVEQAVNSKQRRKDKKRWKYHVMTNFPTWSTRSNDIDRYYAMWEWCKAQYGTDVRYCGWRDRNGGDLWEFDCPKKAAFFALKWAS